MKRLLIPFVAVVACCSHPPQDKKIVMPTPTCSDAVHQLSSKDLAAWHGLPASCATKDLAAAGVEFGTDETSTTLGESAEPAMQRNAKLAGFAEYPVVWLRDGAIARIDVQFPELRDVPALLGALGTPAAKLDAWASTTPTKIPEAEWVWPDRGLALRLSSDRKTAMQLIVFAPTTLERYRAVLRFSEAPRELPE